MNVSIGQKSQKVIQPKPGDIFRNKIWVNLCIDPEQGKLMYGPLMGIDSCHVVQLADGVITSTGTMTPEFADFLVPINNGQIFEEK